MVVAGVGTPHLVHVAQGDHPGAEQFDDLPLDFPAEFSDVILEVSELGDGSLVVVPLREIVLEAAASAA